MKAPKEAYYSLATVLCKAFELNEVKKGKALPVGTTRNWGNKDYVKTNDGWKPKGGGKPTPKPPYKKGQKGKQELTPADSGYKKEKPAEKSVQKGCGKKVKKMGIGTLTTTGNRDQEMDQNRGAMLLEKVKPVEKTSKKLMAYKTLEQILAKAIEYIETDQTLPTGTKRVWKNKTYIKTEKGWSYKE